MAVVGRSPRSETSHRAAAGADPFPALPYQDGAWSQQRKWMLMAGEGPSPDSRWPRLPCSHLQKHRALLFGPRPPNFPLPASSLRRAGLHQDALDTDTEVPAPFWLGRNHSRARGVGNVHQGSQSPRLWEPWARFSAIHSVQQAGRCRICAAGMGKGGRQRRFMLEAPRFNQPH